MISFVELLGNSKGDGIKISNDICKNEKCSGECTCYMKIYGGYIYNVTKMELIQMEIFLLLEED